MVKLFGRSDGKKGQKKKRLWGKDFDIVKEGLDEAQVVDFVNGLMEQQKVSPPDSVRAVLKTAIADAEQLVASVKTKAQAEAQEEAARIIAQASQKAGEIKKDSTAAAEAENPARLQEEAAVPDPEKETVETLLKQSAPEKRAKRYKTGPEPTKEESQSLYTGEVELTITKPVSPSMVSKLYNYLQTTPEIKFVRTSGSWDRGTTITVVLDKPIPLISVLLAKLPEANITPGRIGEDGFVRGKKGVRRITLSLKEA